MGLQFEGYLLEPPRVGFANSPFTATPTNYVYDQTAYDAQFDPASGNPRVEFLTLVVDDRPDGRLANVLFGWTKNEVVARFDYGGQDQRFKLLPGSSPTEAGTLASDSNTDRIRVAKPLSTDLVAFPLRVAVGATTFVATVVLTDAAFNPALPPGNVEVSMETGNLNWSPTDLASGYVGQTVWFQRQTFYSFSESTGQLGQITNSALWLSPIPAAGQWPRVRIGYREHLTPVEVPDEGSFSPDPAAGTVEWARDTGRLKFHSGDVSSFDGKAVYYDGVLVGSPQALPQQLLGMVIAPASLAPLPAQGGDIIFLATNGTDEVQFPETVFVNAIDPVGKRGQVQVERVTGNVGFSLSDRLSYGFWLVRAVVCDLPLEYGIALRLFRSPVDLTGTDPQVKDAAAFYSVEGGTLADPVIQSPQTYLSALFVESLPITLRIEQGTGNWTGVLPDLDVAAPSPGYGYLINYDDRVVEYANRTAVTMLPRLVSSGAEQLGAPLVRDTELALETSPGSGTFVPLVLGTDALLEPLSGLVTFVRTSGALRVEGVSAQWTAPTTFHDATQDFVAGGVIQGDSLVVVSGATEGVYTVVGVASQDLTTDVPAPSLETGVAYEVRSAPEILVDRYFRQVFLTDPGTVVELVRPLGLVSNAPRLVVDNRYVSSYRFRFGLDRFSTVVSVVSVFSPPASLAQGGVEILETSGEVNFSQDDVNAGGDVSSVRELRQQIDYTISPELGFVEFTQRMLSGDEGLITYVPATTGTPVQERVRWIVRKELSQAHPAPTNTVRFNPDGHEVAADPAPAVFRGGRPQRNDVQVKLDVATSTVQFLDDDVVTDALPHGSVVNPVENVYVDYYIFDAVGGEQSTTVLDPPMAVSQVAIQEGQDRFTIGGDRTADFPPEHLLRFGSTEVYHIGSSVYDVGSNETTVVLSSPQKFAETYNNPPEVYVSSGPVRLGFSVVFPSYFTTETTPFDPAARGMNTFSFHGDVTSRYEPGSVLSVTGSGVFDMYLVQGATYSSDNDRTTLTLASTLRRQVRGSTYTLRRSVRPVIEASTNVVLTDQQPDLDLLHVVYRRTEGQVGQILRNPQDYTINQAGQITFSPGLAPNEQIGIFYTGFNYVEAGRRLEASYTHVIAPDPQNGLLGQVFVGDYWVYAPDTFYFRVETMDNFRAELARQYEAEAKASVPSAGPQLFNISFSTRLYEQGAKSVFFDERHLSNEDVVARTTLKFYHDLVNHLEDVLQNMDGRVVGSTDGRFRFDGSVDNPVRNSYDEVTNDIDDVFKVSPAPYEITWTPPTFTVTSIGTYQAMYLPAPSSRFFPTRRRSYGVPAAGVQTGDPVLDTGHTSLTNVEGLRTRLAWALTTLHYDGGSSGPNTTVFVDNPQGSAELARPAFVVGEQCLVQAQDGSFIYGSSSPLTVTFVGPNYLQFAGALASVIPAGSTVYRNPDDPFGFGPPPTDDGLVTHRAGIEYSWDPEEGQILYVEPFIPYDGSFPAVPPELEAVPLRPGVALSMNVALSSDRTAPDRFPALDGGVTDDDGDVRFPIISPTLDCESNSIGGWLPLEQALVSVPAGTIASATTTPLEATGTMAPAGDQLTVGVPFPAPAPKQWDLVRVYDGSSWSVWRQVTTATPTDVFVDPTVPFTYVPGPVLFQVAVAASLAAGVGTVGPPDTLTDGAANFQAAGVLPGHTVVITTGPAAGERRQVQTVTTTTLVVTPDFASAGAQTYSVENPLSTYGFAPGSEYERTDGLFDVMAGELAVLDTNVASPTTIDSERRALEGAFATVFTQKSASAAGQVTVGSPTLTDLTADFVSAGVESGDYVYVDTGLNAGVWRVSAVTSPTTLDVTSSFVATESPLGYTANSAFGVVEATLATLFDLLQQVRTFVASTQGFQTLVSTQTDVLVPPGVVDPAIWSVGVRETDLSTRASLVASRIVDVGAFVTAVTDILASTDRLYDRRYTWIDTRINRKDGILAKKVRAIFQRVENQAQAVKQMEKLLAVT